ncbi:uncharacterized protein BDZ99DRAFT_543083 [Mytilinidion resinicola]|uniref:Uncharacterized protein n=1 Tax=Mytilinidion resinicola TaxID=574789 RepID=A0A6A6Z5W7_9PEZI|nr:uncharacterized protein BDZ99DRAFT_543083 [Mytilinidion resinicola]KAF2816491.1 hypothetical protein BDZ99DRAFT_543083 [Mytilinidion resinicola]
MCSQQSSNRPVLCIAWKPSLTLQDPTSPTPNSLFLPISSPSLFLSTCHTDALDLTIISLCIIYLIRQHRLIDERARRLEGICETYIHDAGGHKPEEPSKLIRMDSHADIDIAIDRVDEARQIWCDADDEGYDGAVVNAICV